MEVSKHRLLKLRLGVETDRLSFTPIGLCGVRSEGNTVRDGPEAPEVLGEPAFPPHRTPSRWRHPHPQPPRAIRSLDSKQMLASRRRQAGRRRRDAGRSLPLREAARGPRPPAAALRTALLRRGAVVVDAAHPPHGRGALEGWQTESGHAGLGAARGGSFGGRAEAGNSGGRAGTARPGPGRSRAGFKGGRAPFLPAGPCLVGSGLPGGTGLGP